MRGDAGHGVQSAVTSNRQDRSGAARIVGDQKILALRVDRQVTGRLSLAWLCVNRLQIARRIDGESGDGGSRTIVRQAGETCRVKIIAAGMDFDEAGVRSLPGQDRFRCLAAPAIHVESVNSLGCHRRYRCR